MPDDERRDFDWRRDDGSPDGAAEVTGSFAAAVAHLGTALERASKLYA